MFTMSGRRGQDMVTLILAFCLFISPWVVGFIADTTPSWNAWIAAIVLGAFAVMTLSAFAEWEEWVNMAVGLWLIASPWLLGFMANTNAMWTHVILGICTAALSAWAVWDYRHPHSHA